MLDNTLVAIPNNRLELDINIFNKINVEEKANEFDFEKINNLIIYEDKKINQLKCLSEEYDMQNEEIQGQYLQLLQRKKFFPLKDQNLRNFSMVLSMQVFKNPNNFEFYDLKKNYKYEELSKFNEITVSNPNDIIDSNGYQENYKVNFNFNKLEIIQCFEEKNNYKNEKKRKINNSLLSRIKISDKEKLLKKFLKKNPIENKNKKYLVEELINNNLMYTGSNEVDSEAPKNINIKINFDNLKINKKLEDLITRKLTKENYVNVIDKLFANEKLVKEKILLWGKKSSNDNTDFEFMSMPEDKKKLYINSDKIDMKTFNSYFVSLFQNEKNINKYNNQNKIQANKNKFFSENDDFFSLEKLSPQIFENFSLPLEKIIEIIKGKRITNENINEIDENTLDKIKGLKELELKIDELTEINNFHLFSNLNKIYLGGNQLANLDFLNNLGKFYDQNCELKNSLEKNELHENKNNLVDSNIDNKFILEDLISNITKSPFEKLLELNFPQNNIKYLNKNLFENLINLRILNLEINPIGKIENLEKCRFLTTLNLAYNKIDQIENLEQLINLEKLLLNGNSIKKIENLSKLTKLKHLSLGLNKIKELDNIENEIFFVEELILYENKLKSIPENFSLPFLKSLYLNKNKIKQISNIFLPNLEELFLQENKILSITCDNKLINYCNKIRRIDLSHNKLENFAEIINFLSYCKNIQVINVNNNPFYVNLNKMLNLENALAKIFRNYKKSDYENIFNNKNSQINKNSNEIKDEKTINLALLNFQNIPNYSFHSKYEPKCINTPTDGTHSKNYHLKEEIEDLKDNEDSQNIIINQFLNFKKEKEFGFENAEKDVKNTELLNDDINEENFELLFDILKSKKRKEKKKKKKLDDLFLFFVNQHSNFLNIFTSKFSQANIFGKNLAFNKRISFEKYFLLDIFNNLYCKAKNNFLSLISDINKDKSNNNIQETNDCLAVKLLHVKLNKNKINEENFRKYIFNLKNLLEFLSFYSPIFTENFRSRKRKIFQIQNNFRGYKTRKLLNQNIKCFNYLKYTNKILKIQKAFRKNFFRKKFLKNFSSLKFGEEEENNFDENIQKFFFDDDNIIVQDSYLQNLNENQDRNINLHLSVIKEEPELKDDYNNNLKEENSNNNNSNIQKFPQEEMKENKISTKSAEEILNKIKSLEKNIKVNEKLEKENKHIFTEKQITEDKKILYNLNIGLNSKNNIANIPIQNINIKNQNNLNYGQNKLNPLSIKGRTNTQNKIESKIKHVDMNNIDFLNDPSSNYNELKVVLRDSNNKYNSEVGIDHNPKSRLPQIFAADQQQTLEKNLIANLNINNKFNNYSNAPKLPFIKNISIMDKNENSNSSNLTGKSSKFSSNINTANNNYKKSESNSLANSNDNFSIKNFSQISKKDSISNNNYAIDNKEVLERSFKSYKQKSDNIYVGGRLLPMKVVEEIRIIEHECREAIKNAKNEWNLQNHLAEELLIKKIKKQYKKKIEKLIQHSHL